MELNFRDSYNNTFIAVVVALFVYLYGLRMSRLPLPDYIRTLFTNNIFRVVFLSLLVFYGLRKSPTVSIAIALVFVVTMHYLNEQEMKENFDYMESYYDQLNNVSNTN